MSYYTSIEEMPIFNYWQVQRNGELRWIYPDGDGEVNDELKEQWEALQQEYFEKVGFTEEGIYFMEQVLQNERLILDLADAEIQVMIDHLSGKENSKASGKVSRVKTQLKTNQRDYEDEQESEEEGYQSIESLAADIEIGLNVQIDTRKTSVVKFMQYVKRHKEKIRNERKKQ